MRKLLFCHRARNHICWKFCQRSGGVCGWLLEIAHEEGSKWTICLNYFCLSLCFCNKDNALCSAQQITSSERYLINSSDTYERRNFPERKLFLTASRIIVGETFSIPCHGSEWCLLVIFEWFMEFKHQHHRLGEAAIPSCATLFWKLLTFYWFHHPHRSAQKTIHKA